MNEMTTGRKPNAVLTSRTYAAPRDLVFNAWSSAETIKRWCHPQGCTIPQADIDFRPGGVFALCMRLADGSDHWCRGSFTKVIATERLAFTLQVTAGGAPQFTAHTTVTFESSGFGTCVTVHQEFDIHNEAALGATAGASEGWRTTLDNLGHEVQRIQTAQPCSAVHATFTIERTYDAAPAVVFHALTETAAKARWFVGGDAYTLLERHMDVRPGGRERVSGRWSTGMVTTFDAVYFDVVPNQRLIHTYEMRLDDRKCCNSKTSKASKEAVLF